jgi:UDP-GlcNAc:undecaprenyl-phosphate/decaprenyl-phosphate GlcNAc-1-phosphate transferase
MLGSIIAFFISFFVCSLIIRSQEAHIKLTGDSDFSGPQKFHTSSVSRIGGIGIALGIACAVVVKSWQLPQPNLEELLLLSSFLPFAIGLTEDLTKKAGLGKRFLVMTFGAALAFWLIGARITRLDIPFLDPYFDVFEISFLVTMIAITGLSNAFNIIDGFNGLSSMVGMIALLALGYLAVTLNDRPIAFLSFTMVAAILGFFILNYPRGLIFLGDGGAYLIGFWTAVLSLLIVANHKEVSPWYALLINLYPVIETLFSIYRRWIHQGKNPMHPDGTHFHSLIYRRILVDRVLKNDPSGLSANALTSPYLWMLSSLSVVPAVLWWQTTWILMLSASLFTLLYLWLYTAIVRFKTPKWLHPWP